MAGRDIRRIEFAWELRWSSPASLFCFSASRCLSALSHSNNLHLIRSMPWIVQIIPDCRCRYRTWPIAWLIQANHHVSEGGETSHSGLVTVGEHASLLKHRSPP
jgi:hypothetical protein